MNGISHHFHIYGLNHIGDMPSDGVLIDQPAILGDLVFHNVKVFNHFFSKGVNKWG